MKWLLLIRPRAESDLESARDWYEQKSEALAQAFLDEVTGELQELVKQPELPRNYFLNFRRILLRRFPYKIFYQVVGQRVIIFRVLHVKQAHAPLLSQE